jgi:NAD(P)-dependent dehydrogenase (short-subunit alcohol dehydrogenase family)
VVVTGAARGIGWGLAAAFAAEGAAVVGMDVTCEDRYPPPTELPRDGEVLDLFCDVASAASVRAAFETISRGWDSVDALIHVAGIETSSEAELISDSEWERMMGVNATGTFLTNRAVFPLMSKAGGSILNFGSAAAMDAYPMGAHYSAAKGAVMAWSRTVAREWGSHGIRVNVIVPSIWTPMYDEFRSRLSPEALRAHDQDKASRISIGGKQGDLSQDLVPVVLFAASEEARFISGQIIAVNGGYSSVR